MPKEVELHNNLEIVFVVSLEDDFRVEINFVLPNKKH